MRPAPAALWPLQPCGPCGPVAPVALWPLWPCGPVWFHQSLTGYERTGATRDAARIRRRLRQLGVRRRHWTTADRPVQGWDSLTDTERSISGLVSQGLTNRQVALTR